jgi:hypothetical protein
VQIFRTGIVEAALDSIGHQRDGQTFLSTGFYEKSVVNDVSVYLKGFRSLSIRTPIWAFLTLTGVEGAFIHPGQFYVNVLDPIDRDILHLPEVVIEDLNQSPAELFRPAFDLIWNAAGLPRSLHFDEHGKLR